MYCRICGIEIRKNSELCANCKNEIKNKSSYIDSYNADNTNNNELNIIDIIMIIVSFIFPLLGFICYFLREDNIYVSKKIKIAAVLGFLVNVLEGILGFVYIVGLINELAPHIKTGLESSQKFFEIF